MNIQNIIDEIKRIVNSDNTVENKLQEISDFLQSSIEPFDWVGFYIVSKNDDKLLILGPYNGESTEHIEIPFGKGICGQAAAIKKTFVVQDVTKESNYLACSDEVKSEIVVPIFKEDVVVAELDIDSRRKYGIHNYHIELCEKIVNIISPLFNDEYKKTDNQSKEIE